MQSLRRRIERIEQRTEALRQEAIPFVFMRADVKLALSSDRCVDILRRAGFLRSGPFFQLIKLTQIPIGIDANELERYLWEHGREICPG